MNTANYILESLSSDVVIYIIKSFFILFFTYQTFIKIINIKEVKNKNIAFSIIIIIISAIILTQVKYKCDNSYIIIFQIILMVILNYVNFKKDIKCTILNTVISLGINYILLTITIPISFVINVIFGIDKDYENLFFIIVIYSMLLYLFFKIKKIKNGLICLQSKLENEYFIMLILNISIMILFAVMILSGERIELNIIITLFIFSIVMFITIKRSLQLYYKQNLLIKELKDTKDELESKKKEVEQLEEEILSFSKKSHSLAHKQKSLEYKLNQLMQKSEIAEELDIKEQVENLSKEIYTEKEAVKLSETGIVEIDDMLKYMQSECIKNKIDFDLQINGNIHHMINNLVSKEELEMLIADHIKDAIIAINYSDNINRSILVRLGKIYDIYGLYIYDSGIEFEIDTLNKLGKEPITTHSDDGGTGMGFMNTFDTLRKHNASLVIEEYNKPNKDNYTKVIMIKFDGKNEFKVCSYREEGIIENG